MKTNYHKTILLIDDDPKTNLHHQTLIKDIYPRATVLTYLRAYHAIDYLVNNSKPDIVFCDLSMPIMSGLDFIKSYEKIISNKDERAPVVLLSQQPITKENVDIKRTEEKNYHVYLKPLTADQINSLCQ